LLAKKRKLQRMIGQANFKPDQANVDHGFYIGVLKTAMPQYRLTTSNFGTEVLKRIHLQKIPWGKRQKQ